MHGVKAQQMGIGLDRSEIVDADHLDILAAGLGDGPQDVAADAAKPVDCDPDCHAVSPLIAGAVPAGRGALRRVLTAVRPVRPDGNGKDDSLGSPFRGLAQPLAQAFQDCVNRRLGSNAEVLEKVLGLAAFAESRACR